MGFGPGRIDPARRGSRLRGNDEMGLPVTSVLNLTTHLSDGEAPFLSSGRQDTNAGTPASVRQVGEGVFQVLILIKPSLTPRWPALKLPMQSTRKGG